MAHWRVSTYVDPSVVDAASKPAEAAVVFEDSWKREGAVEASTVGHVRFDDNKNVHDGGQHVDARLEQFGLAGKHEGIKDAWTLMCCIVLRPLHPWFTHPGSVMVRLSRKVETSLEVGTAP